MNIKVTILEDNKRDFNYLSELIRQWGEKTGNLIKIDWINTFDDFMHNLSNIKCDIFFSDIEIERDSLATGIDACKQLRQSGYLGTIVFLTAFKEYVFEGYDVQAFNYLLKPITNEALCTCLDKYISLHSNDFYYYHKGNDILQIPYHSILYIEKNGHDAIIHTTNDLFAERIPLNEMELRLPNNFVRAHKSFIINMNQIQSLRSNKLLLCNNDSITVGRNYLSNNNLITKPTISQRK